MKIDTLELAAGSTINNLIVEHGSAFPSTPDEGEIFYRNDGTNEGLYSYDGSTWNRLLNGTVADGQITYGGSNGYLTNSATFKWDSATRTLYLTDATAASSANIKPANATNGNGSSLTITAGAAGNIGNGGTLNLSGGASAGSSPAVGGTVNITGGTGTQTGGAINITGGTSGSQGGGGTVTIKAGTSGSGANAGGDIAISAGVNNQGGAGGSIVLSTGATTALTERFRILNNGAWSVGSNGTSYGTSGQVLTSNGNAAPTWQTFSATFTGGTVTGATTFSAATPAVTLPGTGPQLSFTNATSNTILYGTGGVAAPSYTTRSAGTKIVLYPNVGAAAVDFAIGIENSTLWQSVADSSQQFKWYGGTTNIMTLFGGGDLTLSGRTGAVATPSKLLLDGTYANTSTPSNTQLKLEFVSGTGATNKFGIALGNVSDMWFHGGDTTSANYNSGSYNFALAGQKRFTITPSSNGGSTLTVLGTNATTGGGSLYLVGNNTGNTHYLGFNNGVGTLGSVNLIQSLGLNGGVAGGTNAVPLQFQGAYGFGLTLRNNGDIVTGVNASALTSAAYAIGATSGFLHITTSAGAPNGTPTTYTGRAPIHIDSTNNRFYFYNGAWKPVNDYTSGGLEVATKVIEQNSKSADYTLVLTDASKHILHPAADTTARTFTIPANASVAFPIGTEITFVNQNAAGNISIAITSDTMRLAGSGTTGTRTLAANGIARALKITATEWIIEGTNLT